MLENKQSQAPQGEAFFLGRKNPLKNCGLKKLSFFFKEMLKRKLLFFFFWGGVEYNNFVAI